MFQSLHAFLGNLYFGGTCSHHHSADAGATLAGAPKEEAPGVAKAKAAFEAATKHLHATKQFSYKDKPVKALHKALNETLQHSITSGITHEVPPAMLQSLKTDVFVFSGMKTYAELKEASQLLTTDDGQVKPYYQFARDVKKINDQYNDAYLQAEYQFATGSAQMADKWASITPGNDLQYRTAGDSQVRDSHAALNRTTLPATDGFWNSYYPPNGWNCRCTVQEVLPGQYDRSNSAEAQTKADKATTQLDKNGKNKLAMFRFNPGKQGVIFPPRHPYYAQHCGSKLNVSGNIALAQIVLDNEREKCEWQKEVKEMALVPQKIKEYNNGGSISNSILVNTLAGDYQKVYQCCDHFAQNGQQTEILPKVHKDDPAYRNFFGDLVGTKYEGKCPDFKVDGKYYELEGFTTHEKGNALRNMLTRGVKQSANIIIKNEGSTDNHIKRIVFNRKKQGQKISEIWIQNKDGSLRQVL